MINNDELQLFVYSLNGVVKKVVDAQDEVIENNEQGFFQSTWTLKRDFSIAYDDIGLNSMVVWRSPRNDRVWQGRLIGIELRYDATGGNAINVVAQGYFGSAYDLTINGSLSGTTEQKLAALITGGYLPQLVNDTTGIVAAGISSSYPWSTANGGSDDMRVGDAILDIAKTGTSDSQRYLTQVWLDRKFVTTTVNMSTPVARYKVKKNNVQSIVLRRNLNDIANLVLVRYKQADGLLYRASRPDTASQNLYGIDYTLSNSYLANRTPFVRSQIMDITGLDATTPANAALAGDTRLAQVKRLRNDSDAITIVNDLSIYDTVLGRYVSKFEVKAGNWLEVTDLFPRLSSGGAAIAGADPVYQNMFYITSARYELSSGTLTLTPERSSDLASQI